MIRCKPTAVLDTLADLIRINSVNPNYEGGVPEQKIADYVDQFFASRGIETWRQFVFPNRPNVIARVPGRDPDRRIVMEAHVDTVSAVGMTIDPWDPQVRDGKMYGRGACDTKGGLAAMMTAVAGLVEDAIRPACDVLLAATIDEEFSYRGVAALCASTDPREPGMPNGDHPLTADVAIVAEPTLLAPVVASKGLVRWKIETRGKAAHSAKPHLGVNAIETMARVISAIGEDAHRLARQSHPLLGPATCNVGVIQGGVQINLVPERCEIEIDRRMLPGETTQSVLQSYQRLIDSVSTAHQGAEIVMHPPMLTDMALDTDPECPSVQAMLSVLKNMGLDHQPQGVPFCSDASKFGALGIPSMILGPGSIDQAHAAVEFISCDQVTRAVEVYRQFLIEFE